MLGSVRRAVAVAGVTLVLTAVAACTASESGSGGLVSQGDGVKPSTVTELASADVTNAEDRPALIFGISALDYNKPLPSEEAVSTMAALGASSVRVMANWRWLEPQRGRFRFGMVDDAVRRMREHGIAPMLILTGAPRWACPARPFPTSPDAFCAPRAADFGRFARTLARRYRGQVELYEIWNEPNHPEWFYPRPNARRYAALVRAAFREIKAVDGDAQVLFGSLAGSDWDFLRAVLDALGGATPYDLLSFHPYRFTGDGPYGLGNYRGPLEPVDYGPLGALTLEGEIEQMRQPFLERDLHPPDFVLTEFGYGAHSHVNDLLNVTLEEQARFLCQAYGIASGLSYVRGIYWFTDRDWAADPDEPYAHLFGFYGLTDKASRWKPAADVFHRLARGEEVDCETAGLTGPG